MLIKSNSLYNGKLWVNIQFNFIIQNFHREKKIPDRLKIQSQ